MSQLYGVPFLRSLMAEATPDDARSVYDPDRLRLALTVPVGGDDLAGLRKRLAVLLGSENFGLEPLFDAPDPDEPVTYTFTPNGLDRTLPEDVLFSIAADLRTNLGLVACDPDLGATAYVEPVKDVPGATEGVVMDAICWVDDPAPEPKTWALEKAGVLKAWAKSPGKGKGIIVAQPDTGIAKHVELDDTTIDFTKTLNLVDGGTKPTDPLKPSMSNPGHGTGTGSVLASGEGGKMKGAAPKATLVPIRCINDVKIFNAAPVAKAIDHAVKVGAHVISMSLGGFPAFALRQAIKRAIAKDVILLAAAGNCVGLVVWARGLPGNDRGGRDQHQGQEVEGVVAWECGRFLGPGRECLEGGGDRSGSADHQDRGRTGHILCHGDERGDCGLVAGASWPGQGDPGGKGAGDERAGPVPDGSAADGAATGGFPSGLGAGVINAEALLDLALADIASAVVESAFEDPSGGIDEALARLFGPGKADPDFDWDALGPEVAALAIADARAGRGARGPGREARAFRRASAELTEAAAGSRDPRLAQLALRGSPPAPAIILPAPVDTARMAKVLSGLGAVAQAGLSVESAASVDPKEGQARLDAAGRQKALAPLERRLATSEKKVDLNRLDRGLAKLHREGTSARLGETTLIQLEALVSLTERPALEVNYRSTPDGRRLQTIDTTDPELGRFTGLIEIARPDLEDGPLQAVGRIDGDGIHLGTGFVVGPGLVMTNRHVLEEFASPLPRADNPRRWQMVRTTTIDFSPTGNDPAQKFLVEAVAFAGPQQIQRLPISFAKLDLALLKVQAVNGAGMALPKPFRVNHDAAWRGASANLFVVGFPAPPGTLPVDERGAVRRDVIERLREIFGLNYRRKYFSPGMAQAGALASVFNHDATTLGGNSGSVVGALSGDLAAVGLHFAGDWLRANHAHDLATVRAANPGLAALLA